MFLSLFSFTSNKIRAHNNYARNKYKKVVVTLSIKAKSSSLLCQIQSEKESSKDNICYKR